MPYAEIWSTAPMGCCACQGHRATLRKLFLQGKLQPKAVV